MVAAGRYRLEWHIVTPDGNRRHRVAGTNQQLTVAEVAGEQEFAGAITADAVATAVKGLLAQKR